MLLSRLPSAAIQFDLTDEESSTLRKLLADAIEYDRYPLSDPHPDLETHSRQVRADATPGPAADTGGVGPAPGAPPLDQGGLDDQGRRQ
jgi:hypothetical protein